MDFLHPTLLFVHFIGMGLLFTSAAAGMLVEFRLAKAPSIEQKLQIAPVLRSIGLLSPIGSVTQLITGIGNMHSIGASVFDPGWLTAKLFFFAIALVSGILFAIKSRKRGALLAAVAKGTAPADAETQIVMHTRQIRLFYIVLPVLLLIIIALSTFGANGYLSNTGNFPTTVQ